MHKPTPPRSSGTHAAETSSEWYLVQEELEAPRRAFSYLGEKLGSITVGELRPALPAGTRLIAGESGLRREVSWPATLRTRPPAFQALKGGEFLLMSADALRLLDPELTLARLLQSVSRVEVAAAAVVGDVPADAAELGEALRLPLFALPQSVAPAEVEQAIVRGIVDWQSEIQRRSQELYRQLTELAIEGRGLPAIAGALSRATRRSVAYEDRTFNLDLYGPPLSGVDGPALKRAFREAQADLSAWLRNRRLSASEPPCAELSLEAVGLTRLVAPVVLREGAVGYLSLLGSATAFRELDRLALVRAAAACAIEALRESAALEAEDRAGATFLDDLLTGATVSAGAVHRLASRLGYDLTTPQIVMVWQQHHQPSRPPRPTNGKAGTSSALESAIEQELSRRRARALCRGWEDRAALLYTAPSGEAQRAEIQELVAAVASRLDGPLSVGVARPARAAESIPEAYKEAQGALGLGTRLFGPGRVTYYADLGLYRLLLTMQGTTELGAFYEETLGRLLESDRRGSGELMRTLEAYFAGRASPTEAAERLHVHRNTLLYRLRRIQTITGLDLEDPETRLALHLALRVGQVLGK